MNIDLTLPPPARAVGTYAMAVRTGGLLFVSGHGAFEDGRPIHTGRLGESLATAQDDLGDLERVERVIKVVVFVSSTPTFTQQHVVANGATDLLVRAFGE